ncbi:MAG: PAS domain S-box protein, partial [Bacilli bacterium]|nr:PAS domain S-box protein [Bacilli bacterium]
IQEVNETYLVMTGYARRELIGKCIGILLNESRNETLFSQLKTIEFQKSVLMETEHRCKDGTFLPLEASVTALGSEHPAFMCFYRNISKRKNEELSRKHSADLLRYVIEHTRSAVAIHDKNLRYLYVSQKYLDEYALKDAASIIGRHHYEVLPDLPQKWRDVHQRALAGEVLSAEDDPYVRENGIVEYTRWECRPWYTEQGEIGGIIIYTEMITKQKQIEHELREAKNYLETLLKYAKAPIVVWDSSLTITLANQAFASLFDQSIDKVLGKKLTDYANRLPESYQKDLFIQLQENLAISSAELVLTDGNADSVTYIWNASPIFNPDTGELLATIAQGQDITQRKVIEMENSQQLDQLKRWYAVMAHREDRIMELKQEVNMLLKNEGKSIRYAAVEDAGDA